MIRILSPIYIKILISTLLFCMPFTGSTQEVLLELPGSSSQGSAPSLVQQPTLQLLSPEEISDFYQKEPATSENLARPEDFVVAPAVPEEPIEPVMLSPKQQLENFPQELVAPVVEESVVPQTVQTSEGDKSLFPDPVLEAEAETFLENEETTVEVESEGQVQFDLASLRPHRSIMLLPNEVRVFNSAISKYIQSKLAPVEPVIVAEDTTQEIPERDTPHYPLVTLDSMMYRGVGDWVAWVNGNRYTAENMAVLPGLEVISVSREKLTIKMKWVPRQQLVSEEVFTQTGDRIQQQRVSFSKEPEIPESMHRYIQRVDGEEGYYFLTLSPNQAVITDDMTILEGRVVNARIQEIYQQIQAVRSHLQQQNSSGENQQSAENIAGTSDQDQEDLQKLLELYRTSQQAKETN